MKQHVIKMEHNSSSATPTPPTQNSTIAAASNAPTPNSTDPSHLEGSDRIARIDDPAWAHCKKVEGHRNQCLCIYCGKLLKGGGITRLKQHLAGVSGNVLKCTKVPNDLRLQMKKHLDDNKQERQRRETLLGGPLMPKIGEDSDENDMSNESTMGKRPMSTQQVVNSLKRKKVGISCPLGVTTDGQPTIKSALQSKEVVHQTKLAIARWWYDANLPFNAASSYFFQPMIDAIANMGSGFKAPSPYELRGMLLNDCVNEVRLYLSDIRATWKSLGCSIMVDRWTNQKQEMYINFLVYSSNGTMFLKSVNHVAQSKDGNNLFKIFDEVVQEVGPSNVVQFITDNDASYKKAGKKLEEKYDTLFWTPCVAHCVDLMLEDFANPELFPSIDECVQKARKITKFIYNHSWVLALMLREHTCGRDICRPGITRFATNFLSIQCILGFKKELMQMFTSDAWMDSRFSKSNVGRRISSIILGDRDFWMKCQLIVKVSEPLLRVLRFVDSDEKPSMGYLFDEMDRAKKTIMERFKNKVDSYMPYISIIDARWDEQMQCPLYAAACYLNPGIYFRHDFNHKTQVASSFLYTVMKHVPDCNVQERIVVQLEDYKNSVDLFGSELAIRMRTRLKPDAWWDSFGDSTPDLQYFAKRILSQCTSATGCEKNWSLFEMIHLKQRNRLEHKRLNDLIFVKYNYKLRQRQMKTISASLDPISLDNIDVMDDWVSEEPTLLTMDDIDWASVEECHVNANSQTNDLMEVPLPTLDDEDEDNSVDETSHPHQLDYFMVDGQLVNIVVDGHHST